MPNPVDGANPTVVMPYSLAIAFQRSQQYLVQKNQYQNGERQARALTSTSRKQWKQNKRLTASQMSDLETFFEAQTTAIEFFFYDVYETVPAFSYDDTGDAIDGRYSVRFDGVFTKSLELGRNMVNQLTIIEVS